MTAAQLHQCFDWAQYLWESVAMERHQFLSRLGAIRSFVANHPIVVLVVLMIVTPVCWIGWALFGWIMMLPWQLATTVARLLWYAPMLYVGWRLVSILSRRLLRFYGQTDRAQSISASLTEWIRQSGYRVVHLLTRKLLWQSATATDV